MLSGSFIENSPPDLYLLRIAYIICQNGGFLGMYETTFFYFTCLRGDTEKINASGIKSHHVRKYEFHILFTI
jgi:hypothetical protein